MDEKIIISKWLIKLIPKIIPIYYHPQCKGGYFDKKKFSIFLHQ